MTEPAEYNIQTLTDFLKVPPDRLPACIKDFAAFLELARSVDDIAVAITKATGKLVTPDKSATGLWFIWIDDGECGCSEVLLQFESSNGKQPTGRDE